MKIDVYINLMDDSFWIDFGISFQKTELSPTHKYLLSIGFVFFTINFRFVKK